MTSPQPSTSSARQNNDGAAKPVETFWAACDPLTGERFDVPQPEYRKCIPVYDQTGELREFIL